MDQLHIMLKVEYNKHTVNVIEVYAKDDMSNKLLATNIISFQPTLDILLLANFFSESWKDALQLCMLMFRIWS